MYRNEWIKRFRDVEIFPRYWKQSFHIKTDLGQNKLNWIMILSECKKSFVKHDENLESL